MKNFLLFAISATIACLVYLNSSEKDSFLPHPTSGKTVIKSGGDDEEGQDLREKWFDLMHQTAPGTNWKSVEYQNSKTKAEQKLRQNSIESSGPLEELANGNLTGEWFEKGSSNQAGSVVATAYDATSDEIYLISGGGTLFKGCLLYTSPSPRD